MSDWLNSREELDAAVSDGAAVVLYTAPAWCVPCQRFEPHYLRAESMANAHNIPVKFCRVDVDNNEWASVDFGIRGVPTCQLWVDGAYERNIKVPQGGITLYREIRAELGV